jgi:hypothetical protein
MLQHASVLPSFLRLDNSPCMWIYNILRVHSSVYEHLDYSFLWAIVSSGAMNVHVQVFT